MTVRITSLAPSAPVLVPLTTGATLRLSPGEVSADLPDIEVANNAKVDKLQRQGVIDVESTDETDEAARPKTSRPTPRPRPNRPPPRAPNPASAPRRPPSPEPIADRRQPCRR